MIALSAAVAGAVVAENTEVLVASAAASVAIFIVLLLTESRASIASGVVIFAIGLFMMIPRLFKKPIIARFALTTAIVSFIIATSSTWATGRFTISELLTEAIRRTSIWHEHLRIIEDKELFGLGSGGLRAESGFEARNLYLLLLSDYGLLGIVASLGALLVLGSTSLSSFFRSISSSERFLSLVVVFSIVNILLSGFAQDSLNPVLSSHTVSVLVGAFLWSKLGDNPPRVLLAWQVSGEPNQESSKSYEGNLDT